MTAYRSRWTWIGLVMTAVSAGPAAAEPIGWRYRADVSIPAAHADNFRLVWLAQTGEYRTTVPIHDGAVGFQLFRSEAVVGPPRSPDQTTVEYSFDVSFRITDRASGESAVIPFSGWYEAWWTFDPREASGSPWELEYEGSGFGNFDNPSRFQLGRNVYTVRGYGGGPGQLPDGTIEVSVAPADAPNQTPEPGTLALAGLGLAALGAARLRRRGSGPAPRPAS
jgi:hypothetical protein